MLHFFPIVRANYCGLAQATVAAEVGLFSSVLLSVLSVAYSTYPILASTKWTFFECIVI